MSLLATRQMFAIHDTATGLVTDPVATLREASLQLPDARPATMKVVPVRVEICMAEWPAQSLREFGQLPLEPLHS